MKIFFCGFWYCNVEGIKMSCSGLERVSRIFGGISGRLERAYPLFRRRFQVVDLSGAPDA